MKNLYLLKMILKFIYRIGFYNIHITTKYKVFTGSKWFWNLFIELALTKFISQRSRKYLPFQNDSEIY